MIIENLTDINWTQVDTCKDRQYDLSEHRRVMVDTRTIGIYERIILSRTARIGMIVVAAFVNLDDDIELIHQDPFERDLLSLRYLSVIGNHTGTMVYGTPFGLNFIRLETPSFPKTAFTGMAVASLMQYKFFPL